MCLAVISTERKGNTQTLIKLPYQSMYIVVELNLAATDKDRDQWMKQSNRQVNMFMRWPSGFEESYKYAVISY